MPHLFVFAAVGAVAFWGYKKMISQAEKVNERLRRAEREQQTGSHGTLVYDPKTGEYRVPQD
ncbi:hypothetical protein [Limoniibacter endophyticus]|uniref:Membrane protein n=1 Tax=Limoniibacter endophyticus TaxID=1565040 RepID=A0A8J3DMP7_9HYPH|nr:hypothetical protein [Limoniibacter endophyticus]GHC71325.1 membrane protein [Limoniibacter endophyticus]